MYYGLQTLLSSHKLQDTQLYAQVITRFFTENFTHFVILQMDGTYMFNLEGFIPKLCQIAQEPGEDERANNLRTAALQALSSMVFFSYCFYCNLIS